ncbi:MAG TPA: 4'-phosphopantetheinyl transferase superfamily protein [Nocardioidaceae bacterium]
MSVAEGGARWMARGEHELPSAPTWLSDGEADLADGIRFTKRRTEYLLRRWVAKHAVAASTGLPPDPGSLARIEVHNRPSGAPYVRLDGRPWGQDVSLSDRAGWAVCLVGQDLSRVGCDLEIVEPRSTGFVADFLTPAEQEYVAARPRADRDAAANLLWSAKESALKVLKVGLRRDTRSVEVTVTDEPPGRKGLAGWAGLEVRTMEGPVLPGWWRRDGCFLVTVVSERHLDPPLALAGTADLTTAHPVHSWVDRPLSS